jgi:SSS family solute:Na+ symporter
LLHEWGLGGRRFGTLVTWFLVGGDLYTAYTFIAVPALAFGAGAVAFFAVPYTIVAYPIFFLVFPRIWYVCRKHNYITAGDFVRGRFGNRWLALAVTVTGIVADALHRPSARRPAGRDRRARRVGHRVCG